jgi:hypothetical protein
MVLVISRNLLLNRLMYCVVYDYIEKYISCYVFTKLHGVTFCTAILFMVTVTRTSNAILALHNIHIHVRMHTYLHYTLYITLRTLNYILAYIRTCVREHIHTQAEKHKLCVQVSQNIWRILLNAPKRSIPKDRNLLCTYDFWQREQGGRVNLLRSLAV